jgi:MoaA/NifB/PqqE/SkfB family radical SAM enzyme
VQQTYRFMRTPELAGATLTVTSRGPLVTVWPHGFRSPRALFLTLVFFFWLNVIRPIESGPQGDLYSLYFPPVPSPAQARTVESFLRKWLVADPAPMAATIAVTSRCQYRCGHCSAAGVDGRPELDAEALRRVIAECLDLGVHVITLTGGEPLLRDDLEELVAAVPPELATTLVFTNAHGLDAARARSLRAAGLFGVHVSLDSPDPATHDRLRGCEGAFARVERGVHAALDAGLKVGLSTYATHASVAAGDLARLAALAHRWGVHEVTVFDAIPTGRLLHDRDVPLTPADHLAVVRQARRATRHARRRPRVVSQSWTNQRRGCARYIGCLGAGFQVHVTAQGDVTPCDFTPLSFGNVGDEPLATIWRRMTTHPEYRRHSVACRMQDPGFRARYIDTIPAGASLPHPIAQLDRAAAGDAAAGDSAA